MLVIGRNIALYLAVMSETHDIIELVVLDSNKSNNTLTYS